MLKACKYRIYPNKNQSILIEKTFGVCRLVYNLALECKIRAWQSAQKNVTAFDLINQLPDLKKEYPWIGEVNSQAVQAAIRNVEAAFLHFFKGAGYPNFKKKSAHQSFRCLNNTRKVDFEKGILTIPKIPGIKCRIDRKFDGSIRNITISRTPAGKYYASVLVDDKKDLLPKGTVQAATTIGIDLGIKSFVATSKGQCFGPNRYLKNAVQRLQCLQRRVSRKKKGGSNRKKANLKVAKLHEKIRHQRADYCHKITTALIRDNQAETFVMEDLHVAGMLKYKKLSQAISDVSFGEFLRQMKYKCKWYGKNLIQIGRFEPSSKTCSACGHIKQDLTLADREWTCAKCGMVHDRDLNAAKNIKQIGLEQYSRPGRPVGPVESRRLRRAQKQEFVS